MLTTELGSGRTGKYKALGHSAWISPMTSSQIFSRLALALLNILQSEAQDTDSNNVIYLNLEL